MDVDDIRDLYAIVQAIDGRDESDAAIAMWFELLRNFDKESCYEAILAHNRERPGVWIEPGHVLQRVKAKTRDRLDRMDPDERGEAVAPNARRDEFGAIDKSAPVGLPSLSSLRPVASAESRRAFFEEFARMRQIPDADGVAEELPPVNPLTVRCPFCKAAENDWCTLPGMAVGPGKPVVRQRLAFTGAHPSRVALAAVEAGFGVPEDVGRIRAGLSCVDSSKLEPLSPAVQAIVESVQRQHARRAKSQWSDRDRSPAPLEPHVPAVPAEGGELADV